jgi:hypothetical protein
LSEAITAVHEGCLIKPVDDQQEVRTRLTQEPVYNGTGQWFYRRHIGVGHELLERIPVDGFPQNVATAADVSPQ